MKIKYKSPDAVNTGAFILYRQLPQLRYSEYGKSGLFLHARVVLIERYYGFYALEVVEHSKFLIG